MSASGVFARSVLAIGCVLSSLMTAELRAEERPSRPRGADAPTASRVAVCSASAPNLPYNVRIDRHILPRVQKMLQRSATFREQCRRLAAAPWVHVGVKLDPRVFETRSYRAVSLIQRPNPDLLIALITLQVLTDPAVWLAHEFEHVLEQVDKIDLEALADRKDAAWRVGPHMFETKRAIAAGEAVVAEVRGQSAQHDADLSADGQAARSDDHNFVD